MDPVTLQWATAEDHRVPVLQDMSLCERTTGSTTTDWWRGGRGKEVNLTIIYTKRSDQPNLHATTAPWKHLDTLNRPWNTRSCFVNILKQNETHLNKIPFFYCTWALLRMNRTQDPSEPQALQCKPVHCEAFVPNHLVVCFSWST